MLVKTILNRIEKHKRFVYDEVIMNEEKGRIEVSIRPRSNSRARCSNCSAPAPLYDHLDTRAFQYVPLWGIAVVLLYTMRRVKCHQCGVRVEAVPWCIGKTPISRSFSLFLASWAKRLSWQEVAQCFSVNWRQVFSAVEFVVEYGLKNRVVTEVTAIGVDEIAYRKGHHYLTVVYQLCGGVRRLLYVGEKRTTQSLGRFFTAQGTAWCAGIEFVCSDMWRPYLRSIREHLGHAVHILDRFHVVGKLNEAVDKVRRREQAEMKRSGYEDVLVKSKYCFLKNPENLTRNQELKLKDILQYDLKSVRAYMLREAFQVFWTYTSPVWAAWYLRKWCGRANRSKLEPIKKFVKTVRRHEELLLNWFECGYFQFWGHSASPLPQTPPTFM